MVGVLSLHGARGWAGSCSLSLSLRRHRVVVEGSRLQRVVGVFLVEPLFLLSVQRRRLRRLPLLVVLVPANRDAQRCDHTDDDARNRARVEEGTVAVCAGIRPRRGLPRRLGRRLSRRLHRWATRRVARRAAAIKATMREGES
jgi:hypothetical protein